MLEALGRLVAAVVRQAAPQAVAAAQAAGHRRLLLRSGCTLSLQTPFENLQAMLEAARLPAGE